MEATAPDQVTSRCSRAASFVPLQLDSPIHQTDPVDEVGVEIELLQQVRLRLDAPPDPDWPVHVAAALAGLPSQEATS